MPTSNPRVNVTLSPSLFGLVGAMARAQRVSRSQVLRELLESAEPALQRVVALMEAADRAKGAMNAEFGEGLLQSQQKLEAGMAQVLGLFEGASADLVTLAERIEGRRPGRAAAQRQSAPGGSAGVGNPPGSNRGVKSPKRAKDPAPPQRAIRGSVASKRGPTKGGRR